MKQAGLVQKIDRVTDAKSEMRSQFSSVESLNQSGTVLTEDGEKGTHTADCLSSADEEESENKEQVSVIANSKPKSESGELNNGNVVDFSSTGVDKQGPHVDDERKSNYETRRRSDSSLSEIVEANETLELSSRSENSPISVADLANSYGDSEDVVVQRKTASVHVPDINNGGIVMAVPDEDKLSVTDGDDREQVSGAESQSDPATDDFQLINEDTLLKLVPQAVVHIPSSNHDTVQNTSAAQRAGPKLGNMYSAMSDFDSENDDIGDLEGRSESVASEPRAVVPSDFDSSYRMSDYQNLRSSVFSAPAASAMKGGVPDEPSDKVSAATSSSELGLVNCKADDDKDAARSASGTVVIAKISSFAATTTVAESSSAASHVHSLSSVSSMSVAVSQSTSVEHVAATQIAHNRLASNQKVRPT